MLFHRRQDAQITLDTSRVVIANILLDHLDKLVLAGEPSAGRRGLRWRSDRACGFRFPRTT